MNPQERQERFEKEILPIRDALRKQARKLTNGSMEDAEDLLQDAMAHIYNKIHLLEPGTTPYSWSVTVQRNLWITRIRTKKRSPDPIYAEASDLASRADRMGYTERSAEDRALSLQLDHPELKELFDSIPEVFGVVIYLADAEGWSYREIAEYMGIPVGTVMSRLHRGRKRIREAVGEM